LKSCWYSS